MKIIENFFKLTENWWLDTYPAYRISSMPNSLLKTSVVPKPLAGCDVKNQEWNVFARRIDASTDSLMVYENLLKSDEVPSCWLDSARVSSTSRFSYMGNISGPNA